MPSPGIRATTGLFGFTCLRNADSPVFSGVDGGVTWHRNCRRKPRNCEKWFVLGFLIEKTHKRCPFAFFCVFINVAVEAGCLGKSFRRLCQVGRVCRGQHENDDSPDYKYEVLKVTLSTCQRTCEEDPKCVALMKGRPGLYGNIFFAREYLNVCLKKPPFELKCSAKVFTENNFCAGNPYKTGLPTLILLHRKRKCLKVLRPRANKLVCLEMLNLSNRSLFAGKKKKHNPSIQSVQASQSHCWQKLDLCTFSLGARRFWCRWESSTTNLAGRWPRFAAFAVANPQSSKNDLVITSRIHHRWLCSILFLARLLSFFFTTFVGHSV